MTRPPPPERRGPGPGQPRGALLAPTVGTGALMAAYLLLRPYGDATGAGASTAAAFASTTWVVSHLCGALALVSVGRLALRLADVDGGRTARAARTTGLAGAVLVLPYYGAETFALHVLGQRALAGDTAALALAEAVREQPVAVTTFALGLLLLAATGPLLALAWQRRGPAPAWAAWPLAVAIVLFPAQFFLAPEGRMAYGVGYAVTAMILAVAVVGSDRAARRGQVDVVPAPLSR